MNLIHIAWRLAKFLNETVQLSLKDGLFFAQAAHFRTEAKNAIGLGFVVRAWHRHIIRKYDNSYCPLEAVC